MGGTDLGTVQSLITLSMVLRLQDCICIWESARPISFDMTGTPRAHRALRARARINWHFVAAQAELQHYVWRVPRTGKFPHTRRTPGPQPCGARRRAGICGVAAPRRCHHIACVAAPCICPPGARAKMPTYFCANPKGQRVRGDPPDTGGMRPNLGLQFSAGLRSGASRRGAGTWRATGIPQARTAVHG